MLPDNVPLPQAPDAPPPALNANVWLLRKKNVETTMAHPVFEHLSTMEPITINSNTDEVRLFEIPGKQTG